MLYLYLVYLIFNDVFTLSIPAKILNTWCCMQYISADFPLITATKAIFNIWWYFHTGIPATIFTTTHSIQHLILHSTFIPISDDTFTGLPLYDLLERMVFDCSTLVYCFVFAYCAYNLVNFCGNPSEQLLTSVCIGFCIVNNKWEKRERMVQ